MVKISRCSLHCPRRKHQVCIHHRGPHPWLTGSLVLSSLAKMSVTKCRQGISSKNSRCAAPAPLPWTSHLPRVLLRGPNQNRLSQTHQTDVKLPDQNNFKNQFKAEHCTSEKVKYQQSSKSQLILLHWKLIFILHLSFIIQIILGNLKHSSNPLYALRFMQEDITLCTGFECCKIFIMQ